MAIAKDAGPNPMQTRSRRVSGDERDNAFAVVDERSDFERCMVSNSVLRDRMPFAKSFDSSIGVLIAEGAIVTVLVIGSTNGIT